MTVIEEMAHEHEFTKLIVYRASTGERVWQAQCRCGELTDSVVATSALIDEIVAEQTVGKAAGVKEE